MPLSTTLPEWERPIDRLLIRKPGDRRMGTNVDFPIICSRKYMPHQSDSPDVARLLAAVRAEVQARRQALHSTTSPITQSALELQLQRNAEQLEITRVISAHWPLESRSPYERAINLINKVVRRALRWYINPIVEQQNAFNEVAARALRLQIEAYAELRAQLAELDQRATQNGEPPLPMATPFMEAPAPSHQDELPPPTAIPATEELQQLVGQRGRTEPDAGFADRQLRPLVAQLGVRQQVNAHWLLVGHNPVEYAAALSQRLMRRYLRWLINPIVEQQNAFNTALTETLATLLTADVELRFRLARHRASQARRQAST